MEIREQKAQISGFLRGRPLATAEKTFACEVLSQKWTIICEIYVADVRSEMRKVLINFAVRPQGN